MVSNNRDTAIAWRFHNATKYLLSPGAPGEREILMGNPNRPGPAMGAQDLANEPAAFKVYKTLEPIPLPRASRGGFLSAAGAIASTGSIAGERSQLDLATIAHLCLHSNGILKQWISPSGKEILFRAAGCTGARYHLELYLVTGDIDGLPAGVYHYSAFDHSLRQLRSGDYRGNLVAASGEAAATNTAPVIMICTSTFWRNAWRYQDRAYRHVYWDTGTLFSSLLTIAADANVRSEVVLGFDDVRINELIGVNGDREATVALVSFGEGNHSPAPIEHISTLNAPAQTDNPDDIDFPLTREMHAGSSLSTSEVAEWRGQPIRRDQSRSSGDLIPLRPRTDTELSDLTIESVIERRRSNRHYDRATPLPFELFSTVLTMASHGTRMDVANPAESPLHDVYLIVNNVEGIVPGSYFYHRDSQAIELLQPGDQRGAAASLACDQSYAADAHVNVYALTDLHPLLDRFGNRGYRLAQLEAALFGGRLQLAAHTLGLGAVGSTSADDDVLAHFSPHAAEKSFMFIAVFGIRRKPSDQERADSTRFIKTGETTAQLAETVDQ